MKMKMKKLEFIAMSLAAACAFCAAMAVEAPPLVVEKGLIHLATILGFSALFCFLRAETETICDAIMGKSEAPAAANKKPLLAREKGYQSESWVSDSHMN